MLEDYTMEKKPSSRSVQAPGKGSATESKKSQDVTNKPFPRSRRREPAVSTGPKYEPNRKPVPQKNKTFDKRPRPRGQHYGSGKEDSKVAEEEGAEYGSVFVPGSKKQNLNHLLNFHYAPRDDVLRMANWRIGYNRQGPTRWMSTHKHKYNKEQFLLANCQFVVKADGDYTSCVSNPDALVSWDLIEQIHFQSAEFLSCPICLYPPVSGKMTRCGHVFCWPCILHYLALSDKSWRKCPICYEAVHKQDLKSVVAVPHTQFCVGDEITMRLMKRERGSLVVTPVLQSNARAASKLLSVSDTVVDTIYSKLLLATPAEVQSIIGREKRELLAHLAEEQGAPEMCFIEQALTLLGDREASVENTVSKKSNTAVKDEAGKSTTSNTNSTELSSTDNKEGIIYTPAFDDEFVSCASSDIASIDTVTSTPDKVLSANEVTSEMEDSFNESCVMPFHVEGSNRPRYESGSSEDGGPALTAEDLELPTTSPHRPFYFYQASDGQHIYLHALNVRMLEHLYGTLEHCPPELRGRIVEKEAGSMTEELRHRLRYLQHLPVTCQFEVAELQLQPPVVSQEVIDVFQDQLEMRKRRRHKRARDERRREKKITEEENRRWGRYPAPHIHIDSFHQFPQYSPDTDIAGITAASAPGLLPNSEGLSAEFSAADSLTIEEVTPAVGSPDTPSCSFAQMLREGKVKARTVQVPSRQSDSDQEPDGYTSAPTYRQSFGAAMALALQKAAATKGSTSEEGAAGKKKKKQKQKVLFATGLACSGK